MTTRKRSGMVLIPPAATVETAGALDKPPLTCVGIDGICPLRLHDHVSYLDGVLPMKAITRFRSVALRLGALLLGFAFFAGLGLAQDRTPSRRVLVGDVIVQGNRRKTTQEIIGLLRTRVGADYNPA